MWGKLDNTFRYTLYGALFGLAFPVLSSLGDLYLQQLPLTIESLLQVQKGTHLHWVIDTAPLFLALFASLAGRRQDQLLLLSKRLNHGVQERDQAISQLEALRASLEQQVTQRTTDLAQHAAQLEAAAQVVRGTAQLMGLEQLLKKMVHLICDRFGFYHAGIYMLDAAGKYAVLQAASSEGGQRILGRRHKVSLGEGNLVAHAARTGEPRVALDVRANAVSINDPDREATHSELALPLQVRGQVIGVLDIQSSEPAAFSDEDLAVLQALADQTALIIDNARLWEQSQRALKDLDVLYGRRIRKVWQERVTRQPVAFRYTGLDVESILPSPASETGDQPSYDQPTLVERGGARRLIAPIRLHGQSIGSIMLQQYPEEEGWSPEEIALLEEVSTQIGLALESARLLEETQRRAARERLTGEISARMRETLDVDTVLETAIREIGQALNIAEIEVRMESGERATQSVNGHEQVTG